MSIFARLALLGWMFCVGSGAFAQSVPSPTINGGNATGSNNLGGSTNSAGAANDAALNGLGLNQGVTFDFTAVPQDTNTGTGNTPQWATGLRFNSTTELQVQPRNTSIPDGGSVTYTFDFSDDIWGYTFAMNGFDNGDYTEISAFRDGVQVPLDDSYFTSNGTNVSVSDNGAGTLIISGPGNNDAQEFFSAALPIDVIIDELVFASTGKLVDSNGTVTLQYNGIGWARPDVSLTKSSAVNAGSDGITNVGDTITYTYVVNNDGRVPLENVVVAEETFTGNNGTPSPSFQSGTGGGTPSSLPVGETLTFTATYILDATDIAAGVVDNRAEVTALPAGGVVGQDELTDLSDSSNPGDGGATGSPDEDDPTSTRLVSPGLLVEKTATATLSSPPSVGDTIAYTITVENTGNVTLSGITPVDTLTDADGSALALTSPVTETSESGTNNDLLDVGETITYSALFTLTQAAIDAGGVENTAVSTGSAVETDGTPISGVPDVSDTSDDPADLTNADPNGDGNPGDPTVTTLTRETGLRLLKTATESLSNPPAAGDTVDYTITVENIGNVALASVTPVDTLTARDGDVVTLTTGVTEDNESVSDNDILDVGETITYTASITLSQDEIDAGGLDNVAISTGNPVDETGADIPGLPDVTDTADDPTVGTDADPNGDGNPGDPTPTDLSRTATLEVTKTAATAFSTPAQPGDVITYTIEVENTGNVALGNLVLDDTLTDAGGGGLTLTSGPTEQSESLNDNDILQVGETITYQATFALTQIAIDTGGVENTVNVTGTPVDAGGTPIPGLSDVNDVSDDPAAVPDNGGSDPTVTTIDRGPSLEVLKTVDVTNLQDPSVPGEVLEYTITVTNTGNVALAGVLPVDTITDRAATPNTLALTSGPTEVNESITDDDILEVGETITYAATYELQQADIDNGGVINSAESTGNPVDENGADIPGLPDVSDVSDDPAAATDTGGSDPTITPQVRRPELELTKAADTSDVSSPAAVGDEIIYTFTLRNTGNVSLSNVTPADTLTDANGAALTLTSPVTETSESLTDNDILQVGETITYTAIYALEQSAINAGGVSNTAVSTGTPSDGSGAPLGLPDVTDTSDDPADATNTVPAGESSPGDPTVTTFDRNPELRLEKTASATLSTPPAIGDVINYTITVVNTGNVALANVTPVDTLTGIDGTSLTLTTSVAETGESITDDDILEVGETITYSASFELTQDAIDAGGVDNTAVSTGDPVDSAGDPISGVSQVTDTSDDPADTTQADPNGDGNPGDPTTTLFDRTPDLRVLKTANEASLNDPVLLGDEIVYTITVENTGNVALGSVTPVDTLTALDGTPLTLTTAVTETSESITDDDILEIGETITYTAAYELTQPAIDAGGVENTAIATGNPVDSTGADIPGISDVSDTSDDPTNADDNDPNGDGNPGDPTQTTFAQTPDLRVEKTAVTSFGTPPAVGDTIDYTITVENTGNLALAGVTPVDTLTDANGQTLTLTNDVTESNESVNDNDILDVGETITYTASFDLTQAVIDAGGAENTAVSTGNPVDADGDDIAGLPDVSDTSDDPAEAADNDPNGDGNPGDPTVTSITQTPDLRLEKTAVATLSAPPAVGDEIAYTIEVVNTGNVALADVTPVDTLTDLNGGALSLTTAVTKQSESITDDDILQVGETITYTAAYELTQPAINAGGVENTAVSTGNPVDDSGVDIPGLPDVSDTSDDPTDAADDDPNGDGNPGDPTSTLLSQQPELRLEKTADTSAFGSPPAEGDVITYTIEVVNTGNVALAGVTPVDTLTDATGASLTLTSGPDLVSESVTTDGILQVGETISYEVTFALDMQALNAGGTENTAVSTGNPVDDDGNDIAGLADVSDTSDDPTDTANDDPNGDGNPGDPTTTPLDQNAELQLTKTVAEVRDVNNNGFTDAGDFIDWTFRIENVGNVTLTDVSISDSIASVSGAAITLEAGEVDEITFTATYEIDDDDVIAGGVENSATATGTPPPVGGVPTPPISDVSDTGAGSETTNEDDLGETGDANGTTDDDGDPTNDPTVVLFTPEPALTVTKFLTSVTDTNTNGLIDAGDLALYSFTVRNTGNVVLAGVEITDPLVAVSGGPIDLSIGDEDTTTFTATYEITEDDVIAGGVENTAEATGNAVDAAGDPLTDAGGAALTATDTSDAGTEPRLDAAGDPVEVTDPETTETPDANDVTDGDETNDPTVLFIPRPEISLIKSVGAALDSNNDGLFGGEDDFITYTFTVRNVGNTDLVGITVDDPLFTVDGGPIDLAIGEGDSVTFTGQYQVLDTDIDLGYVENTATAAGDAELDGTLVFGPGGAAQSAEDTSDTGTDPEIAAIDNPESVETPDGEGVTDDVPDNDPTVVRVPANPVPSLSVVKTISNVVDTNGSGITDAGDTITYSFTVTNTGNVALADVEITDARVGPVNGSVSLAVGAEDTTSFTATAVITDEEAAQGFIENTASATGEAVNSAGNPISDPDTGEQLTATDTSDAGSEPRANQNSTPDALADPAGVETVDGNGQTNGTLTDDPTVLFLPDPSISLIKSVTTVLDSNGDGIFGGLDDEVVYSFSVTNTGNTALQGITIDDPIVTVSDGPIDLAIGAADSSTFTARKTVTNDDLTRGYVENTAVASGTPLDPTGVAFTDAGGAPLVTEDTSDSGTDPAADPVFDPESVETPNGAGATDGNPANDPTVVSVPAEVEPEISIIKSVASVVDTNADQVRGNAEDIVTYILAVTNTGNTDLVDVVVNDQLLGGELTTIASLPIGESETVTAEYTLTDDDVERTFVENSATATGAAVNSAGTPILDGSGDQLTAQDVSDAGTDPETTTIGNPEGVETPDGAGETDSDPTNDPTVLTVPLEPSDASVSGIVFVDNEDDGVFDEGTDSLLPNFVVELLNADGDVIATTTTNEDGFYSLAGFPVSNNNTLNFINPNTEEVVGVLGDLDFIATPNLTNQNAAISPTDAGGVLTAENTDLTLAKTTTATTVIIGQVVPYEIVLTNNTTSAVGGVSITDTLPQGLLFIEGTAAIDGTAATPEVTGQTQTFTDLTVPGSGSITVTLNARVLGSAPVGELVNAANTVSSVTGDRLTPTATASVRRRPEAVFDCSDVIGKVFNDRNLNGYQDGLPPVDRSQVTDQDLFVNGKIEKADPPPVSVDEPGIAGVRLVTPTGTIITTDEYGRYSVPCAELPANIGSNFTLKLDTRSLPTGFRTTTENPRTMRVTAGIMTEMNFGAAIGRVVDVDLSAAAFVPGQTEPVDRLEAGLQQLLRQVAETPSIIRISYYEGGEGNDTARARLNAVEALIQEQWRQIGSYRLIIEKTVKRLQ